MNIIELIGKYPEEFQQVSDLIAHDNKKNNRASLSDFVVCMMDIGADYDPDTGRLSWTDKTTGIRVVEIIAIEPGRVSVQALYDMYLFLDFYYLRP